MLITTWTLPTLCWASKFKCFVVMLWFTSSQQTWALLLSLAFSTPSERSEPLCLRAKCISSTGLRRNCAWINKICPRFTALSFAVVNAFHSPRISKQTPVHSHSLYLSRFRFCIQYSAGVMLTSRSAQSRWGLRWRSELDLPLRSSHAFEICMLGAEMK
jgi:hypothetical protein